jgi:hypothetical protein
MEIVVLPQRAEQRIERGGTRAQPTPQRRVDDGELGMLDRVRLTQRRRVDQRIVGEVERCGDAGRSGRAGDARSACGFASIGARAITASRQLTTAGERSDEQADEARLR